MSNIEDIIYNAEAHGQRTPLLKEVSQLRVDYPNMKLNEVYEVAYKNIMRT
tara:strand:- start:2891 stop:3043 length:153 start_codon:yes stop_codon:yes gene_type:complete